MWASGLFKSAFTFTDLALSFLHQIAGSRSLAHCGMGMTLEALGTVRLPVRVHHSHTPRPSHTTQRPPTTHTAEAPECHQQHDEEGVQCPEGQNKFKAEAEASGKVDKKGDRAVVMLTFVVVEGRVSQRTHSETQAQAGELTRHCRRSCSAIDPECCAVCC